ncbi:MAG: pentapeptide repeat-containing protein [Oscillospiraceae bacterium]|nr:pentapeptide repeat-containing protein [Oscillospiraceae bacterium]
MKRALKDNILFQPVEVKSYSNLFREVGKAIFHGFNKDYDKVLFSLMDAVAELGVDETEDRLAWTLVNRSVMQAISALFNNCQGVIQSIDEDVFIKKMKKFRYDKKVEISTDFFNYPKESGFVKDMQEILREWLETVGVDKCNVQSIVYRFPSFFIYSMNTEWSKNPEKYRRLCKQTPFSDSVVMDEDWERYRAYLKMLTEENVFEEAFSLSQIYVPLYAYYEMDEQKECSHKIPHNDNKEIKRCVIGLEDYILKWMISSGKEAKDDAIRIICGGPGSGKSSFAKMFASSASDKYDVLFIQLHKLDLTRDIKEVVGDFLTSSRLFNENPIGKSEQLLIIFDGLDEISQQGVASLNAARDFIAQIQQLLHSHNHTTLQIRVIVTGRDLSVQEIQTHFRIEGQILHVLPFYVSNEERKLNEYVNSNLLNEDRRNLWWGKYGELTGKGYVELPNELQKKSLDEVTAQPLLNYLLALSYDRGNIEFTKETNLNDIYYDLIDAVYERGYQSPHKGIKGRITKPEYEKILEEIAVSAWQGAGRTTTIKAIEKRCEKNSLDGILRKFQEQASEIGVTNLLMAFYFRDAGVPGADKAFEFTHKSFGEYLAARKIVKHVQKTQKMLKRQIEEYEGWSFGRALEEWIDLCSNAAIDSYIFEFVCNEIKRNDIDEVKEWQKALCELISYMLKKGMPMEKAAIPSFLEMTRQSRNAEEALLVALSACSWFTNEISEIKWEEKTSAGEWLVKLCGQRKADYVFVLSCLNHLDLSNCDLIILDLYNANLAFSILQASEMAYTNLVDANLGGVNLKGVNLRNANLEGANLKDANLEVGFIVGANLKDANLANANLVGADLRGANLKDANFECANLANANLVGADLRGTKTNLKDTNLEGANFEDARFSKFISKSNQNEYWRRSSNMEFF